MNSGNEHVFRLLTHMKDRLECTIDSLRKDMNNRFDSLEER
jgi:hypothetical protein